MSEVSPFLATVQVPAEVEITTWKNNTIHVMYMYMQYYTYKGVAGVLLFSPPFLMIDHFSCTMLNSVTI